MKRANLSLESVSCTENTFVDAIGCSNCHRTIDDGEEVISALSRPSADESTWDCRGIYCEYCSESDSWRAIVEQLPGEENIAAEGEFNDDSLDVENTTVIEAVRAAPIAAD